MRAAAATIYRAPMMPTYEGTRTATKPSPARPAIAPTKTEVVAATQAPQVVNKPPPLEQIEEPKKGGYLGNFWGVVALVAAVMVGATAGFILLAFLHPVAPLIGIGVGTIAGIIANALQDD